MRLSPHWIIALACCLPGCTAIAQQGPTSLARLDALIGTAPCSADAQCRVIGIGSRSCGGPSSFRAWSTQFTNERALVAAAETHAAEQAEIDRKLGAMSTCVILPEPAVACVRGTCTLQSTGASSGRNVR